MGKKNRPEPTLVCEPHQESLCWGLAPCVGVSGSRLDRAAVGGCAPEHQLNKPGLFFPAEGASALPAEPVSLNQCLQPRTALGQCPSSLFFRSTRFLIGFQPSPKLSADQMCASEDLYFRVGFGSSLLSPHIQAPASLCCLPSLSSQLML